MRVVFFVRELTSPERVSAGSIRQLTEEQLAHLRGTPQGAEGTLDITPRAVFWSLSLLAGRRMVEQSWSTAKLFPCPWCVEVNKATGEFRVTKALTRCRACGDTRAIVIPGTWPNVLKAMELQREAA